jgi:hypothetical protein
LPMVASVTDSPSVGTRMSAMVRIFLAVMPAGQRRQKTKDRRRTGANPRSSVVRLVASAIQVPRPTAP